MYILSKSPVKSKKYRITTPENKNIDFGATGYSDFTKHKDVKRKNLYILRHQKNEDWTDKNTAGFWARWVLWNKPTIKQSIKHIENKFNIEIKEA